MKMYSCQSIISTSERGGREKIVTREGIADCGLRIEDWGLRFPEAPHAMAPQSVLADRAGSRRVPGRDARGPGDAVRPRDVAVWKDGAWTIAGAPGNGSRSRPLVNARTGTADGRRPIYPRSVRDIRTSVFRDDGR